MMVSKYLCNARSASKLARHLGKRARNNASAADFEWMLPRYDQGEQLFSGCFEAAAAGGAPGTKNRDLSCSLLASGPAESQLCRAWTEPKLRSRTLVC
jgi:hypothetical protein